MKRLTLVAAANSGDGSQIHFEEAIYDRGSAAGSGFFSIQLIQ